MARTQARGALRRGAGGEAGAARGRLDLATVLGLVSGFGLVVIAISAGGTLRMFLDLPSLLIVIGGTFGITTIAFSLPEIAAVHKALIKALFHGVPRADAEARRVLELSELARRNGALSLAEAMPRIRGEPFLAKALQMVIDGYPIEEVERVMGREVDEMTSRHRKSASVLRKAAEVSPAMGLIGTLIGLVQMLGNLDDPASIGPAMALALLTTFYGAVLSNMAFAPLAAKLERNSAEEAVIFNVYLLGAVSIGRKENPRRLEMLLNAHLPPSLRVRFFD